MNSCTSLGTSWRSEDRGSHDVSSYPSHLTLYHCSRERLPGVLRFAVKEFVDNEFIDAVDL